MNEQPTKRIHFDLQKFEPFSIEVDDKKYLFSSLKPLSKKSLVATNISEYVYKIDSDKYVYLTVVGDEDQESAYGIQRGWYVAEIISEDAAQFLIDALSKFTALYQTVPQLQRP